MLSPSLFLFFSIYARASMTSFCIWLKVAEPFPANSIASNPKQKVKRNALVCPKGTFVASKPTFVAIISSKTFHTSAPMVQFIKVVNNPAIIDTNRIDRGENVLGNAPLCRMQTHVQPSLATVFGPLLFHQLHPKYMIDRWPSHAEPTTNITTGSGGDEVGGGDDGR